MTCFLAALFCRVSSEGNSLSNYIRNELTLGEDEVMFTFPFQLNPLCFSNQHLICFQLESPMVSGAGPVRSKKNSADEYNVVKVCLCRLAVLMEIVRSILQRRGTPVALKTSLSVPSIMSTNAVSPAVSEKSRSLFVLRSSNH